MKKVLVATEKPFAKIAVDKIKNIFNSANYQTVLLEKYSERKALLEAVSDVDALIVRSDKVTKDVFDSAKNLKIVVRAGAGYDNIDLEEASKRNIVVMNTPGQNANAVAELAICMMLYIARNELNGKEGTELRGKTLGLQAYGNVGKYVAQIAKGLGMEIYAYDPFISDELIKKDGINVVHSAEELYSKCQYVSIHIPLNEETEKSINYNLMSKMPQGATLVNTARKEVINEEDLCRIMKEREDFKYVSDIIPDCKEEIEKICKKGRYFFTPQKMGAQTKEANINAGVAAANQIVNFFEKGDRTFQVNK